MRASIELENDMCSQTDEKAIISRARRGNKQALGQLYELYVDAVYRYMLYRTSDPQVAEDITAEVFASMITSIKNYEDRGLPFGAWLFQIARARLVDYWRKTKRRERREITFSSEVEEFFVGHSPEEIFAHEDLLDSLQYLSEAELEIVLLRFSGGLSNQEIASVIDSNSNAVKSMMYRALQKLRKIMSRRQKFTRDELEV